LRTEQLAVVVAPTPNTIARPSASNDEPYVVLPRHAAGFNFTVAQAELEKLASVITSRSKEIESLHAQLDATKTVRDELARWFTDFGGTKLGTLREKLRGEQQGLEGFQEHQRKNSARQGEVKTSIDAGAASEELARQELGKADKAVA